MCCREIVDNHEKENALNVVTDERTYQIYAESPEDARYTTAHHFPLVAAGGKLVSVNAHIC